MNKKARSAFALLALSCVPSSAQEKGYGRENNKDLILLTALAMTASDANNPLRARTMAIDALGKLPIKDPKTLEQQREILQSFIKDASLKRLRDNDDDEAFFMIHVVQALGNMGHAARDALADLARARGYEANLSSAVEDAVAAILAPIPAQSAATKGMKELLADLANEKSVMARLTAAKALSQFADSTVIPALAVAAASDPDPDVKSVAGAAVTRVKALVQLNRSQYVACLISMLDKSNDVTIRMMAAKTLGSLGVNAVAAVTALTKAAEDPDPDLKFVALNALKSIQPKK